jgi:hypothetical protein
MTMSYKTCYRRLRAQACPIREDFRLDLPLILSWFEKISTHYEQLPFPEERQPGFRYCYENGMFSYSDAISLFGMLLELRPRHLIEVGSGYSSCVSMDTNDLFLNRSMQMKFIEPFPQRLFSILPPEDSYRGCVERVRLQKVPLEWFTTLEAGDILFIDSSHVGKLGSDVNHYFFRIFPPLASGVYVHMHDVFYPFEYPSSWILEQNRSWNEARTSYTRFSRTTQPTRSFISMTTCFRNTAGYWNPKCQSA